MGSDDVIAQWESAKLLHRSAPVYAAGDAIARELEACRAELAIQQALTAEAGKLSENVLRIAAAGFAQVALERVQALADELESETFPRTLEGQAIESTQLRIAGKLRAALTAPASDAQAKSEAPLPETPQE